MKLNFFAKHFSSIFLLAMVVFAAPLMGQQVVNDRTGQTYTTIQSAINAASGFDTLLVSPATYRENITVNKPLCIKGNDKDNTIIIGNGLADAILITASIVTIKGFTIKIEYANPYYYYGPPYAGIKILSNVKNTKIECNNILDCYRAVFLEGGDDTNNRICNNVITNDVVGMLVQDYYSFWIIGSSGNKIYCNTISSTLNQSGYGILLGGASNNEIFANEIYGNYYGIYLYAASNDNTIHHNNFDNVLYNAYTENSLGQCTGNMWYLEYTSIGNYWSDHTGPDANNDGIIDTPYYIPGGNDQDPYPLVAQWLYPVFNADDLVVRTSDERLLLFPFENEAFVGTGIQVGHGWNFTHYLVGDWNDDYDTHDLIVRKSNGDLQLYPYRNETFYSYGSKTVGSNFNYTHYFVGNWTNNGSDDLIVRDSNGYMWLFTYQNESFGPGINLGSGWNYTHYFVGNWSGNGTPDIITRDSSGYMWYYRFQNGSFSPRKRVGNGWNFTHYFAGNWTNDGDDDLIVRDSSGNMRLYPFRNESFYYIPGAGKIVATGWNFTDYFVDDWKNNDTDDMIVRNSNGDLKLYPFENEIFGTGVTVGKGFNNHTHYFVGQWTTDCAQ